MLLGTLLTDGVSVLTLLALLAPDGLLLSDGLLLGTLLTDGASVLTLLALLAPDGLLLVDGLLLGTLLTDGASVLIAFAPASAIIAEVDVVSAVLYPILEILSEHGQEQESETAGRVEVEAGKVSSPPRRLKGEENEVSFVRIPFNDFEDLEVLAMSLNFPILCLCLELLEAATGERPLL